MHSFLIKSYVIAFCFSLITPAFAADNNGTMLPEPAQMLSKYVQIPSVSGQEKDAGEFFSQFCRDNGLYVHILTDEADSYNFVASLYPLEKLKPNIVLLSHIDVVPAGDEDSWTYPPFSGMIADGMVWGRGAIDNKAMGVMHVYALLDFVERAAVENLPFNVSLLAVSGEETGGDKGARIVADRYLDVLNPVAVYGEGGAGLQNVIGADPERVVFGLAVAQKRILWLSLESSVAASGHGSVPRNIYPTKEVINATSALLGAKSKIRISPTVRESLHIVAMHERGIRRRIMQKIDLYGPLFGRFIRNDPLFRSMLTNTMSLTSLTSTDGAYNMIPTRARAIFDCRLLPETSEE